LRLHQHCSLCPAPGAQAQQPSMGRINPLQDPIVDDHFRELRTTGRCEWQPQVVPIDTLIDPNGPELLRTVCRPGAEKQPAANIRLQVTLMGPDLAPGDPAVVIRIESDRELRVPQCQLDGTVEIAALDGQCQKAVTGNVSVRRSRPAQRQCNKPGTKVPH